SDIARLSAPPSVIFSCVRDVKPLAETVILYLPGGRVGKLYEPAEFVFAVWLTPFSTLTSVTWASATIPPEGSVTVPSMALRNWACATPIKNRTSSKQAAVFEKLFDVMAVPPLIFGHFKDSNRSSNPIGFAVSKQRSYAF